VNEALSCVEEPLYLVVNYTTPGGSPSSVSINIETCTNLSTSRASSSSATTSYVCGVTDDELCDTYEVRVAYQSVVLGEVNFSDALLLQAPSEGECVCVGGGGGEW
jgi:hypothetical protein